jgi:integrase
VGDDRRRVPEARLARARAVADVGKVFPIPDCRPAVALGAFYAEWIAYEETIARPATRALHRNAFEKRIRPKLEEIQLSNLTRQRLEAWLGDLARRDSHRRAVEQAVDTMRSILTTAVLWGHIEANAATNLRLPKRASIAAEAVRRVLNQDEIPRLLAAAGSLRNETMLRMAVEVGLRKGEIIGLRWADVDLEARRIRVSRSVWQGAGGKFEHTPKNGRSRMVAIGAQLAEQLGSLYSADVIDRGADATG